MIEETSCIEDIKPSQVDDAKRLLQTVWNEYFATEEDKFVRTFFDDPKTLADLDDVQTNYFADRGTFVVVLDDNRVIGTGAIKCLDKKICELRRMFLLKEYRGRGLGKQVAQYLLEFARTAGYEKIRLGTNKKLLE